MNPLLLPYALVYWLVSAWWNLNWQLQILLLMASIVLFAATSLTEAGPARIAALARRFSWSGYVLASLLLEWNLMLVLTEYMHTSFWFAFYFGLLVQLSIFLVWCSWVWSRGHWTPGIYKRAYARIRFRLRWDSIAKSCALSHMKDVRPKDWQTGGSATTVLAIRVQWVPTLWHGRRNPAGDATDYLFRPARGFDTSKVQESFAAMAIAADAHSVTMDIAPVRKWPWFISKFNWWRLTVYWSDPAAMRPDLDQISGGI